MLLSPAKARKILRDGKIRGKPLTPAQKRLFYQLIHPFFGGIAKGSK